MQTTKRSSMEICDLIMSRSLIDAIGGLPRFSPLGSGPVTVSHNIAPNTHAQLESFYAVPQIGPKTATGKIQKYLLRGGRANIAKQ